MRYRLEGGCQHSGGVPRGSREVSSVFVGEEGGVHASDDGQQENGAVYGRELLCAEQRDLVQSLECHHDVFYHHGAVQPGEIIWGHL